MVIITIIIIASAILLEVVKQQHINHKHIVATMGNPSNIFEGLWSIIDDTTKNRDMVVRFKQIHSGIECIILIIIIIVVVVALTNSTFRLKLVAKVAMYLD